MTERELVLVSRSRNRAGGNCNLDCRQGHDPNTNVFAMLSKKAIQGAHVYLLGDEEMTRENCWLFLKSLQREESIRTSTEEGLRIFLTFFFFLRISSKVRVWHHRTTPLSLSIQNVVLFLKSYHASCHRLITTAAGSS